VELEIGKVLRYKKAEAPGSKLEVSISNLGVETESSDVNMFEDLGLGSALIVRNRMRC